MLPGRCKDNGRHWWVWAQVCRVAAFAVWPYGAGAAFATISHFLLSAILDRTPEECHMVALQGELRRHPVCQCWKLSFGQFLNNHNLSFSPMPQNTCWFARYSNKNIYALSFRRTLSINMDTLTPSHGMDPGRACLYIPFPCVNSLSAEWQHETKIKLKASKAQYTTDKGTLPNKPKCSQKKKSNMV